MESCIYEGRVWHRRRRPVEHEFEFPLFMLYLDLAELPELFRRSWLWSADGPAFAWFRRADHLGDPERPLDVCVRDLVERRTGRRPLGPVRLLTQLRYAGYVMNPISAFYCFDPAGSVLETVVAEVNNTPWGERHCYVVRTGATCEKGSEPSRVNKEFHVSPFMAMDLEYHWDLPAPAEELRLGIKSIEPDGGRLFEAVLRLERREISATARARCLFRYPLMSLQTVAAIYWQALRLRVKGAPFHPHPCVDGNSLEVAS